MSKKQKNINTICAFICNDHRYVYLCGSVLAGVCIILLSANPAASSFLSKDNATTALLIGLCDIFILIAAVALIIKVLHWKTYSRSVIKNAEIVKISRLYSYLLVIIFALTVFDRLILKFIYTLRICAGLESNPSGFFNSMVYMTMKAGNTIFYGVWTTVKLALLGTAIAFVLGIMMAFLRIQKPLQRDNDFVKFLKYIASKISGIYITIIRGTPMMVQGLIIYYTGFSVFKRAASFSITEINHIWSPFIAGLITISINSTAYLAEIIRGGILSIDTGQTEAARSLGMSNWKTMRKVIFPQAIKNSIPAIGNEFIINIKESSVLSVIGVMDLMFATNTVSGTYYRQLEIYCMAAIIYLILTYLSSLLLNLLSSKLDMPKTRVKPGGKVKVETNEPNT